MTWPPEGLDVALAENAATAAIRQLAGVRMSWGEMIATAQSVQSNADDLEREEIGSLYESSTAAPLIAAARIFDSASDSGSGLPDAERISLAQLAVVSFAMHGNFASAAASARKAGLLGLGPGRLSPGSAVALAVCLPNYVGELAPVVPDDHPGSAFIREYLSFLATGEEDRVERLRDALVLCLADANGSSAFDGAMLRLSRMALEHAMTLSVPRVLGEHSELPAAVIEKLIQGRRRVFLPPQYRAIAEKGLLTGEGNAMVALPTSTGKTLLGALTLLSALGDAPGLVCYVTPWVATARQAADSLQAIKPRASRLLRLIGGYDEQESVDPLNHQEIVVATPERLDGLLRALPELRHTLKAVVFDEAHLVENAARGVRLEGILARLRMFQEREPTFRLIFLSAVLTPDEVVQSWLRVDPENALVDGWRPTARRTALWAQDGRLEWYSGDDVVRRPGVGPADVIGHADIPWPRRDIGPAYNWGVVRKQAPRVRENVAYLADFVKQRLGTPLLCVCATKAQTREIAGAVAERLPPLEPLPQSISAIRAAIDESYPHLRQLRDLVGHGVAFHNSSLPHRIRSTIEDAVSSRDIIVTAATTTLAEGVDLPFRSTIIVDWLMWSGGGGGATHESDSVRQHRWPSGARWLFHGGGHHPLR